MVQRRWNCGLRLPERLCNGTEISGPGRGTEGEGDSKICGERETKWSSDRVLCNRASSSSSGGGRGKEA